jgi:hypothetical protein
VTIRSTESIMVLTYTLKGSYVKDHVPQFGTDNRGRITVSGEDRHHEGAVIGKGYLVLPYSLLVHVSDSTLGD